MNIYESELGNIFISSLAVLTEKAPENVLNELTEDDYTIYVTIAHGEKCERCWKYREMPDGKTVCDECLDAINE